MTLPPSTRTAKVKAANTEAASAFAAGQPVALSPLQVDVLNALGYVYDADGRATIRSVADTVRRMSGHEWSVSAVHRAVNRLAALGMVAADGPGSLRPGVSRVDC